MFEVEDSVSQIIGTSEAFTYQLSEDLEATQLENPDGLLVNSYLYGLTIIGVSAFGSLRCRPHSLE